LYSESDLAKLVEEHQSMVFRLLARLLNNRKRVEDLAQNVFLGLFRALPYFRAESSVSTFIYRISLNVAFDERSRQKRARATVSSLDDVETNWTNRLASSQPDAEKHLLRREVQSVIQDAMHDLSDNERSAIVLFHQEELS
jgi:RNA polymerase sigma-70 factor (ECF subfamily)